MFSIKPHPMFVRIVAGFYIVAFANDASPVFMTAFSLDVIGREESLVIVFCLTDIDFYSNFFNSVEVNHKISYFKMLIYLSFISSE